MRNDSRPWYARISHGRYLLFLLLFLALPWPAMMVLRSTEAFAASFDVAALVFIASVVPLWLDGPPDNIRRQAERDDGGQVALLLLTTAIGLVMMTTVGLLLRDKKELGIAEITLIVSTLLIVWTFSNLVFAFHYARLYYRKEGTLKDHGGLDFPGEEHPVFSDFVNFSFVIGMTCQTADINITGPKMRRVATGHGVLAFIFNLGILALTVNIVAGSI